MNRRDIRGFQEVIEYLEEKQTMALGIKRLNRFQMQVLKYVGIGESMQYYPMGDYDLKDLIEVLNDEVEKWKIKLNKKL